MEQWARIEGADERYRISDFGRIWSANIGIMKTPLNQKGYPHLSLKINGINKRWLVHRLVASTFLENPLNLREVNHKFGIKHDNRVSELEWVSSSENKLHSFKVLGTKASQQPKRKRAILATYETGEMVEFDGVRICARTLNMPYQAIQRIVKGKRKTYQGWIFERIPKVFLQEIKPKI